MRLHSFQVSGDCSTARFDVDGQISPPPQSRWKHDSQKPYTTCFQMQESTSHPTSKKNCKLKPGYISHLLLNQDNTYAGSGNLCLHSTNCSAQKKNQLRKNQFLISMELSMLSDYCNGDPWNQSSRRENVSYFSSSESRNEYKRNTGSSELTNCTFLSFKLPRVR